MAVGEEVGKTGCLAGKIAPVRLFKFEKGEVLTSPDSDAGTRFLAPRTIVDLDSIVMLQETLQEDAKTNYTPARSRGYWHVQLSGGYAVSVSKTAFERILLAWRSK